MDEKTEMLHKLCKALMEELDDYSKKIEKSDGMSAGDLEAVDKLTHALKSVKTTVAMMESEDGGYSGMYPMRYYGNSYEGGMGGSGGNSNRRGGNSNARGGRGGRNNNPSGRNQYSRESGNSYNDDMQSVIEEIEGLLPELSSEKRRAAQRLIEELRY